MRRRLSRLAPLLLAACLLFVAAGCADEAPEATPSPTPGPSPSPSPAAEAPEFALPCYPQAGFHPITGYSRTNLLLGGLLYEGLFELDEAFAPQNLLCASYTVSEDGLTWRFILQSGVTFSDGSALTAADAAYSLKLAKTSALYSARLAGVADIKAAEDAVTITLSAPNGNLPALLDIPIIKETGGVPLGTGPYVLTGEGDELSLTARVGWWQNRPLPKAVIPLRAIQETDDLIRAFDTRSVSLVSTDLTGTNALGFSGSYETLDFPTSVMLYVGFNCISGPCQDEQIRQALQVSFDRTTVTTTQLSRHAQAAALPVSPACALYDEDLAEKLGYAPQTAEALLLEAGWSKETGTYAKAYQQLELTFVAPTDNAYKLAAAEQLAQNLEQAGFVVDLQKLSWEDYLNALELGNFDLYLGEVRMTADFDPAVLIGPSGALNFGGYADEEASALLSAFQAAQGEARQAAARALYQRLSKAPPFAVICFKSWSALTQWNQASNLTPTQQNVFYHFTNWMIS